MGTRHGARAAWHGHTWQASPGASMFLSSRTDRTLYGMTNWSRLRVKDLQYREVRLVVEVEKEGAVVMVEVEAVVEVVVSGGGGIGRHSLLGIVFEIRNHYRQHAVAVLRGAAIAAALARPTARLAILYAFAPSLLVPFGGGKSRRGRGVRRGRASARGTGHTSNHGCSLVSRRVALRKLDELREPAVATSAPAPALRHHGAARIVSCFTAENYYCNDKPIIRGWSGFWIYK